MYLTFVDSSEDIKFSIWKLLGCVFLAGIAMLCKEHGITVIVR